MSSYTAVLRSIGGKFSLLKNILFFIVKILPKSLLVNFSNVKLYINPQDLRNLTDTILQLPVAPKDVYRDPGAPLKYKNRMNEAFYSLIEKDDCVIDVGGNIGLFTILGSKKVGEGGRIITFEPESDCFRLIQKNIELHKCRNVIV